MKPPRAGLSPSPLPLAQHRAIPTGCRQGGAPGRGTLSGKRTQAGGGGGVGMTAPAAPTSSSGSPGPWALGDPSQIHQPRREAMGWKSGADAGCQTLRPATADWRWASSQTWGRLSLGDSPRRAQPSDRTPAGPRPLHQHPPSQPQDTLREQESGAAVA